MNKNLNSIITILIVSIFLHILSCKPWGSKNIEITLADKGDITLDYANGYKFSEANLPRQGEIEEEINRRMGIPTRRWTFNEKQVMKLKNNEFNYNKILLYGDSKRVELRGEGYVGFENRELIDVSIFLLDGNFKAYTISHFVLDSEKQWKRGSLDSGDTTTMEPIMESFPDSTAVYKKYWEQFGTHPAHARRKMPKEK